MIFDTLEQGRDAESEKIVEDGDLGSGLFSLWMSITPVNDRSFDLALSLSLSPWGCVSARFIIARDRKWNSQSGFKRAVKNTGNFDCQCVGMYPTCFS